MTHTSFLILLFCALSFHGHSQITGLREYKSAGVSFTIPDGWFGQETDNGLLIASKTVQGFILVMTNSAKNIQEMNQMMGAGIALEGGTNLALSGSTIKLSDNAIAGIFSGMIEYEPAKAYLIGLENPFGTGISVLAAAQPNLFSEKLTQAGISLAESVHFSKPQSLPKEKKWFNLLKNCRLTYMNTYTSSGTGGYSDKTVIDLCGQGYFNYYDNSSFSVGTAGSSAAGRSGEQNSGTWTVLRGDQGQAILQLTFKTGEVMKAVIEIDSEGKTYLDGTRYFRTYEGRNAPDCF